MDSLPNELIVDIAYLTPWSYRNMMSCCAYFRDLLAPFRDRFADLCVTMWRMENHVYGTLSSDKDGPKHTRETLYDGNMEGGRKIYEIDWRYGLKHGKEIFYDFRGNVNSILNWHNGVKWGKETIYYNNGCVLTERTWVNDVLKGEEILYAMTGEIVGRYEYL